MYAISSKRRLRYSYIILLYEIRNAFSCSLAREMQKIIGKIPIIGEYEVEEENDV